MGASEYIPWTLWLNIILSKQGYNIKKVILYQDNESAVKMENDGLRSSGDRTRHLNIFLSRIF